MLQKNDVLQYSGTAAQMMRVVWIDPARRIAYTFQLGQKSALPEQACVDELLGDLASGRARLASDPYPPVAGHEDTPRKHLALRDRAWAIICGLPLDELALYQPRTRGTLVTDHSVLHAVSYPTVYRYLRRYWERGQHPDALLPDYCNSGAPGKTRGSRANVKRGRPAKSGQRGLNADAAIRLTFRAAVTRYAEQHAAFCRRAAYREMIVEFFKECSNDALPSFGQFNYWIEKDACLHQFAATHQNAQLVHAPGARNLHTKT